MSSTKNTELPDLVFAEGATGSFGNVNIPEEAFAPENTRVRISIMIPEDVLARLRVLAKEAGKPYQTFINDLLRARVYADDLAIGRFMQEAHGMLKEMKAAHVSLKRAADALEARDPKKKRAKAVK